MGKYIKAPRIIDAIQWRGNNADEIQALLGGEVHASEDHLVIPYSGGNMSVAKGYYIVKETSTSDPILMSEFKFNLKYTEKK